MSRLGWLGKPSAPQYRSKLIPHYGGYVGHSKQNPPYLVPRTDNRPEHNYAAVSRRDFYTVLLRSTTYDGAMVNCFFHSPAHGGETGAGMSGTSMFASGIRVFPHRTAQTWKRSNQYPRRPSTPGSPFPDSGSARHLVHPAASWRWQPRLGPEPRLHGCQLIAYYSSRRCRQPKAPCFVFGSWI